MCSREKQADAILSKWPTEGGKSVMLAYKCGDQYCGRLDGLLRPWGQHFSRKQARGWGTVRDSSAVSGRER